MKFNPATAFYPLQIVTAFCKENRGHIDWGSVYSRNVA